MVNTIVALDLGTTHLRGIEAQVKKGSLPKIIKIHSIPLESQIIVSGLIENEDSLKLAIKKLWTEAKFKSKIVVGMATGDAYDNRVLKDIPWSPPEDFKRLLTYYLRDRLPFDTEDYYFDAHTLEEYYKEDLNDQQRYKTILVAGVNRKFSDTFIKILEESGLRPLGIDIMPLALIRSYYATNEAPLNSTIVSIELGGDITTIVIHKNSQPIYINTASPLGGLRITEAISKELHMTLPEAEMIKRAFAMSPEEQRETFATTFFEDGSTRQTLFSSIPEDTKNEAFTIIAREVSNIVGHISDILEDAFSNRNESPFEIALSGGGAELNSLLPRIQSELGIPTRILAPFGDEESKKIDPSIFIHQNNYVSIFGLLVGQEDE